ncbi:hypothetical protein NP233_g9189 [Leucocoprinus birnbaumii]|uniref:Uncharacterized protein n=1 Tax=Leucocoprinus birnbaumii TaxID=56174 RepID=A0AAD5YNE7_9AGAR|nr:hypothetical protein NP233_g9189 [Leucocoprinus birnbaumii]
MLDTSTPGSQLDQLSTTPRSLPTPAAPVILAWAPLPAASTVIEPEIPNHAPPGYDFARTPVVKVKYQLSSVGPNGCRLQMLLTPDLTTVVRGGSPDGEVVGDFEMGYLVKQSSSSKLPTIYFKEEEYKIKDIMGQTVGSTRWRWKPPREDLALGRERFEWDSSRSGARHRSCVPETGAWALNWAPHYPTHSESPDIMTLPYPFECPSFELLRSQYANLDPRYNLLFNRVLLTT